VVAGGGGERDNLVLNDPAEVSLLKHSLEIVEVEFGIRVEIEFDGSLQPLQTINDSEREVIRANARVTECNQAVKVGAAKYVGDFVDRVALDYQEEACVQENGIGLLGKLGRARVDNFLAIAQCAVYFFAEPVELGQVQGAEVRVVALVFVH